MTISRRYQNLVMLLFALGAVLGQLDRQSIAILKTDLMRDLAWSDADYASVVALSQLASAWSLLFAGIVVDRISLRSAGAFAVVGWSLAMLAQGTMRTFTEAAVYRFAQSIFQAISVPGGLRVLREILPSDRRALGIAVANAAGTMGGIVAPLALPLAALWWGWRGAFVALGLLGLVWASIWQLTYRPSQHSASGHAAIPEPAKRSIVAILRDRLYWLIAAGKTLSDIFWWLTLYWLPDFFHRQFGLSTLEAGTRLAFVYSLCALGAIVFGAGVSSLIAGGRQGAHVRLAALAAALLFVLPLPAAMLAGNAWLAALLLGIALFGHQGFSVTVFAIIAESTRRTEFGRVLGFCSFCSNMGGPSW